MVFGRSRSAVWTVALVLCVCLGIPGRTGAQDAPAPTATKVSSANRSEKGTTTPRAAAKKARSTSQDEKVSGKGKSPARSGDSLPAPTVMSKTAADARRPRSQFLMPPNGSSGSSEARYNLEVTDWSELPTWRQTSFFGLRARGQFFVFVVDQSGSMIDDDRLIRAKIELLRTVFALQPPQRFEAIFYNEEATPMPGGPQPRPADLKNKNQLTSWLHLIGPDGGTDPKAAMAQALALQPDAVFLLSDGEFPEGTVERVAKLNAPGSPSTAST